MAESFPDYYQILNLSATPPPTPDDIRTAYKKESLRTHPDRNPHLSEPERRKATENFQKVRSSSPAYRSRSSG